MDFIQPKNEYDLITMGEVMLRLSPPGTDKISQSYSFDKKAGGAELNVASGSAILGIRSALITKIPESKIGHFVRNMIRYGNVSDDYIVYDHSKQARLGIYYYETGAYPRKSSVIYDRANASVTTLTLDEIDPSVYGKTRVFHVSGITLALGEGIRKTTLEVIKKFKEAGAAISFDINYRASLWDEDTARSVVESIFPYVDILFVSEETSRRMLRKTGELEDIMKSYCADYGCKVVATTRREAISPKIHNFSSKIYYDGNFYEEKPYENIEVVDRVGSGDAYLAGTLFGMLKYGDIQRALEYGNAMSSVKNTVLGDMSCSSLSEIDGIIKAHKAEGVQDEMNR